MLITISIAILLIYLALPNFMQFFANTNIRTAAETINNGMKQAQGQAIKLNTPVQFVLDSAALPTKYQIMDSNNVQLDQAIFQAGCQFRDVRRYAGRRHARDVLGPGPDHGHQPVRPDHARIRPALRASTSATRTSGSARKLAVVSDITKGVKLCDPMVLIPDPKACP